MQMNTLSNRRATASNFHGLADNIGRNYNKPSRVTIEKAAPLL